MSKLAINGGTPVRSEPFAEYPQGSDAEKKALIEVLESGNWGGYPSPNTWATKLNERFAQFQGAKYGIACSNGTDAIYVALRAAGVKAGDEVITTPYTWIATCQAPALINAVPVFADVDPDTYCIDPDDVERKITDKTKAIVPVHLGCRFADMDRLMEIAEKHDLIVVEDCAHAHGGQWKGRGAGSIGHLGTFSFQSSKLLTAGEGGMIITSDRELMEKCHSLINCGRKEEFYCNFEDQLFGWNFRLAEWECAVLCCQLDRLEEYTLRRERNIRYLSDKLDGLGYVKTLKWDERITRLHAYQFIFKFVPDAWEITRDQFSAALTAEGFENDPYFYVPVYQNALFKLRASDYPTIRERYGDELTADQVSCPNAEHAAYAESLWMHYPIFMGDQSDMDQLLEAIVKIHDCQDELLDKPIKAQSRF
ncbi:MAG: DegT/DnrJ/EryC1/StrS family aminotransferase [Candidatus Alcyoniella australis]|nr:DegT/DnrJ/EryC1/StrS family aminotransferase [Candidatus Alcyoniella australis]